MNQKLKCFTKFFSSARLLCLNFHNLIMITFLSCSVFQLSFVFRSKNSSVYKVLDFLTAIGQPPQFLPCHCGQSAFGKHMLMSSSLSIDEILSLINCCNDNIEFTKEPEKDGQLPFLDILIIRQPDNTIKTRLNRKSTHTHTNRYLNFKSTIYLTKCQWLIH